jgi:hypothetical protein
MEIHHIQNKRHLLNTLEWFRIYNLTLHEQQMNDKFVDTNNTILDVILKMYPT